MALVEPSEVQEFLGRSVVVERARVAIRVAEGWLRGAIPAAAFPDLSGPVPEPLWSWAVELAAIAYDNPVGHASKQVRNTAEAWHVARREEILAAARARYGSGDAAAGPAGQPQGCFPALLGWPDPAVVRGVRQ